MIPLGSFSLHCCPTGPAFPLPQMFNKVTDKSAKTATLTKVNPALIDEILDVGRATDYGQKTTPEQVRDIALIEHAPPLRSAPMAIWKPCLTR